MPINARFLRILGLLLLSVAATTEAHPQATSGIIVSRNGTREGQPAPRERFTGVARVHPLFESQAREGARPSGGVVTFDAGARTAWHTHPRGQTLIVTAGIGRVQRWGDPAEEIRPGDIVWIPPGVKHWHGAAPNAAMTHVALAEALEGRTVDWGEQVSDAQYAAPAAPGVAPVSPAASGAAGATPSRAQSLMGDIAPKLAQLTDSVLFGDVWARPGLSRRDRSLATVSALIAMNRPDQLRSHLALALQNGVTREELVEAIIQMAFYSGWPNAVTAVGVAREVFEQVPR